MADEAVLTHYFEGDPWRGEDDTVMVIGITDQALRREAERLTSHERPDLTGHQALAEVKKVRYWHVRRDPVRGDINVLYKPRRSLR